MRISQTKYYIKQEWRVFLSIGTSKSNILSQTLFYFLEACVRFQSGSGAFYFSGAVLSYYYSILFRVYTAISSSFLMSILSLSTQSSWSMRYPGSGSQCLSPSTGPIRITQGPEHKIIMFKYYIIRFSFYRVLWTTRYEWCHFPPHVGKFDNGMKKKESFYFFFLGGGEFCKGLN